MIVEKNELGAQNLVLQFVDISHVITVRAIALFGKLVLLHSPAGKALFQRHVDSKSWPLQRQCKHLKRTTIHAMLDHPFIQILKYCLGDFLTFENHGCIHNGHTWQEVTEEQLIFVGQLLATICPTKRLGLHGKKGRKLTDELPIPTIGTSTSLASCIYLKKTNCTRGTGLPDQSTSTSQLSQ
jgi:hypothetical protein